MEEEEVTVTTDAHQERHINIRTPLDTPTQPPKPLPPLIVYQVGQGHHTHLLDPNTHQTRCGLKPHQTRIATPQDPTCTWCQGTTP